MLLLDQNLEKLCFTFPFAMQKPWEHMQDVKRFNVMPITEVDGDVETGNAGSQPTGGDANGAPAATYTLCR